jgi:small subunit ribosomal protein S14
MAKKGKIEHNAKRKKLVERYAAKRAELRKIIKSPKTSDDDREEAVISLQKLPRNSAAVRYRNRCRITGRPRAYYRKFQMSRIALREYGLRGEIAGLTKASW